MMERPSNSLVHKILEIRTWISATGPIVVSAFYCKVDRDTRSRVSRPDVVGFKWKSERIGCKGRVTVVWSADWEDSWGIGWYEGISFFSIVSLGAVASDFLAPSSSCSNVFLSWENTDNVLQRVIVVWYILIGWRFRFLYVDNLFVEDHIPDDLDFSWSWVPKSVSLLGCTVANEKTEAFWIQFFPLWYVYVGG